MTETDREPSREEQSFLDALHISNMKDLSGLEGIKDGEELYDTLTITGEAMPEEQIYSVHDLETLIRDSFQNQRMYGLGLPLEREGYYGIDMLTFLELCGMDMEQDRLSILARDESGAERIYSLKELRKSQPMIALGGPDGPLEKGGRGPISLEIFQEGGRDSVQNLRYMRVGPGKTPEDPFYGFHNREPFLESKDRVFTIEIYQQGAEYLGAVTTKEFTTEALEALLKEYPEAAAGGYYGALGNVEMFSYMGVGGWLDHFEGIDLKWLLREQAGVEDFEGYGEFIGRDGQVYATVEDLAYMDGEKAAYYVLTSEGVRIPGAEPMIAFSKNGYPLLPEHDHESEGYIAYNQLNQSLEKAGVATETGVVKNHSGPFAACLGNRDGYYGGNETETAGDCVKIRLYLK